MVDRDCFPACLHNQFRFPHSPWAEWNIDQDKYVDWSVVGGYTLDQEGLAPGAVTESAGR